MRDEESRERFEEQARERVEALRKTFDRLTRQLTPSDEPAPVFKPAIYPQER